MNQQLPSQHLQIIHYAVQAGWFGWDTAMQWVLHLTQTKCLNELTAEDVWVSSSLLTYEQLNEALKTGKKNSPVRVHTDAYSALANGLNSSFEADVHHSYETLMALPSVTLLRKQRERVQEQHERLMDELGGMESSPVLLQSTRRMRTEEYTTLSSPQSNPTYDSTEEPTEVFTRRTIRADDLPDADDAPTHDEPPSTTLRPNPMLDPVKERYALGPELGYGGGGRVVRAFDSVLGRYVAMKIMHNDVDNRAERLSRFMAEAQTTGQLEHPNIVPIYDVGTLSTGDPYYTMQEVRNSSLRKVLEHIRNEDEEVLVEYSLFRLVNLLKQVCQALSYAHDQGVVHRDLKPDNIMLGDYGEVLLMDWGLARYFDAGLSLNDRALSAEGKTMGTPAYMPPEQAQGDLESVDELSDIYSLGAILYEILTLEPPFVGSSPLSVMLNVVEGDLVAPSMRAPFRHIPEELEKICMKAMSPRKQLRFKSAREMHQALTQWSEGLQPREADRRITDGNAWGRRYTMLRRESEALVSRVRTLHSSMEPWAPVEQKRMLWSLEDRLRRFHLESARAFGHAVANYSKALVYVPDHEDARQGLADLYWNRYQQAEEEQDFVNALYFKALIAQYDDNKAYTKLLERKHDLALTTSPSHAHVQIAPLHEKDRRLITRQSQDVGISPCAIKEFSQQHCLITASLSDRPDVCVPVRFDHRTEPSLHIHLPEASKYLPGFVYVPAGHYISGGDPNAFDPTHEALQYLDAFFCSTFPVTFKDYLEWIDFLHQTCPERALGHVPRIRSSEGPLAYFDEDLQRWVPDPILIEGPARERYPLDEGHEWNLPVIGVNAFDAEAFASWKSEQTGFPVRLPTSAEMEKAARGTDGRFYTWGNHFDATFCKMRFSRKEPSQLEPVGTFAFDVSPFGVRDLSGGVQEWCRSDRENATDCPVFGGSWTQDQRACRLANRVRLLAMARTSNIGIRLVYDLND